MVPVLRVYTTRSAHQGQYVTNTVELHENKLIWLVRIICSQLAVAPSQI